VDASMPLEDTKLFAPGCDGIPVTIFIHVFHLEIWTEILAILDALTLPYQLVVTSPHPQSEIRLPRNAIAMEFHRTANLGRDIGPFLTALDTTRLTTDVCLKIHTKRSLHRSDGEIWRKTILEDLLGDPDRVNRAALLLRENPKIGLVSPNNHLVPIHLFLGSNGDNLRKLIKIYEIDEPAIDMSKALFIAGSMFWFRSSALALLRNKSSVIEFEPESGQLDGTSAHAHERIFSLLAERSGFLSVTVDELEKRDHDDYRMLPASERLKRDLALFSQQRETAEISTFLRPLEISSFLTPSSPKQFGLPHIQRLYHKLPVGFRRMVRRTLRRPH
jgi:lipopolysaccharide biosynthesis protein